MFRRIIERCIKLERRNILVTDGTGQGDHWNRYPEVEDGKCMREDRYTRESSPSTFCTKPSKGESQTSSGGKAEFSAFAGRTTHTKMKRTGLTFLLHWQGVNFVQRTLAEHIAQLRWLKHAT